MRIKFADTAAPSVKSNSRVRSPRDDGSAASPNVSGERADNSVQQRVLHDARSGGNASPAIRKILLGQQGDDAHVCMHNPTVPSKCPYCNEVLADPDTFIDHLIFTRRHLDADVLSTTELETGILSVKFLDFTANANIFREKAASIAGKSTSHTAPAGSFIDRLEKFSRKKVDPRGGKILIGQHGDQKHKCLHIPNARSECPYCNQVMADSEALIDHLLYTRRHYSSFSLSDTLPDTAFDRHKYLAFASQINTIRGHAARTAREQALDDASHFIETLSKFTRGKPQSNVKEILFGAQGEKMHVCTRNPSVCPECPYCNEVLTNSDALIDHLLFTRRHHDADVLSTTELESGILSAKYLEFLTNKNIFREQAAHLAAEPGSFIERLEKFSRKKVDPRGGKIIIGQQGDKEHNCLYIPGARSECPYCNQVLPNSEAFIDHLLLTRRHHASFAILDPEPDLIFAPGKYLAFASNMNAIRQEAARTARQQVPEKIYVTESYRSCFQGPGQIHKCPYCAHISQDRGALIDHLLLNRCTHDSRNASTTNSSHSTPTLNETNLQTIREPYVCDTSNISVTSTAGRNITPTAYIDQAGTDCTKGS